MSWQARTRSLLPPKYFTPAPEAVHTYPEGRECCTDTAAGKREYYRRTREMAARQDEICAICLQFMVVPTFEHQDGRGFNGSHRDDRIEIDGAWHNAALCFTCQGKGSKRYQWIEGIFREKKINEAILDSCK